MMHNSKYVLFGRAIWSDELLFPSINLFGGFFWKFVLYVDMDFFYLPMTKGLRQKNGHDQHHYLSRNNSGSPPRGYPW